MKMKVMLTVVILAILLVGCTTAPVQPPETTGQTLQTQPTAPSEDGFTLADLELNDQPGGGLSPEPFLPIIYKADTNFRPWGDVVMEAVAAAQLKEGYLYRINTETGEIILLLDEPVLAAESTENYIFCITGGNKLVLTDYDGELYAVIYEAHTQLQPKSLNYWKKSLYFIDGDRIIRFDLLSGVPTVLIAYEGAIDADPLYGIDHKYPHLLCIRTATEDVACNLETGQTAVIPETGDYGTMAFELFMGQGIWPEEEAETQS